MAFTVRPAKEPPDLVATPSRAGVTQAENVVTLAVATWLLLGLFVDGYAHDHLLVGQRESFFTSWHALFYSGYLATVAWLAVLSRRHAATTRHKRIPLPAGYEAAGVGLAVFAIGGVGDAIWHTIFGFERSNEALVSPTHLLLFIGLVLIVSAPFRAGSQRLLALVSVTLATSLVAFFGAFAWGLANDTVLRVHYDPATEAGEVQLMAGLAGELVTTMILAGGALFVLRIRQAPRASCTVMFTIVALAFAMAFTEEMSGVLAASVGGATIDFAWARAARWDKPTVATPTAIALGITAMWWTYHALLFAGDQLAWSAPLSAGSPVLSGLAAGASVLIAQSGRAAAQAARSISTP